MTCKKSCKRVPFLAGSCLGEYRSLNQIYHQISLPFQDGTIHIGWFFPLRKTNNSRSERAAFCSFSKASLTVEAALAVPLFFMITICIISMINLYGKTLERGAALRDTAMTAALAVSAKENGSDIQISLPVLFSPLFLPDDLGAVWIPCQAYVRAWTGRDDQTTEEGAQSSGTYVFITENQSVYHTSAECTHLDLTIYAISANSVSARKNEYGSHYHACEKCVAGGKPQGTVYITPYGDCYHTSAECSGLKRTVRLVNQEELGDSLGVCSRCAAKAA